MSARVLTSMSPQLDTEVVPHVASFDAHRPAAAAPTIASDAAELFGPAPSGPPRWVGRYRAALVVIDFIAAAVAMVIAFALRFGGAMTDTSTTTQYLLIGLSLPFVWILVTASNEAYDACLIGAGAVEFQRIYLSFFYLLATVAIFSFAFKADLSRGFLLVALPLTVVINLVARYAARKWLHRRRLQGHAMSSVVIVGRPSRVAELATPLMRDTHAGLKVVGACLPRTESRDEDGLAQLERMGIPILGELDDITDVVRGVNADTVAVASSLEVGPEKLRWISWQLENTRAELVVSPGLIDVAGTRINVRPVAGLPLLHVEAPNFSGFHRVVKGAFDRISAASALLILSPFLLSIALIVRTTSKGPAFFRQTRVGRDGSTFTMVKFRSMYQGAEAQLAELAAQNDNSDGLLFKMREDPRITPIGRVLRKFSLDELPQLFNVLSGSMSLVGPRPPLPSEVAEYADHVRRRLLVRPGLTGLWQVSGRSDLSWEDSVRLDLRYVENWSLALDVLVLWKTVRAVLGGSGAY